MDRRHQSEYVGLRRRREGRECCQKRYRSCIRGLQPWFINAAWEGWVAVFYEGCGKGVGALEGFSLDLYATLGKVRTSCFSMAVVNGRGRQRVCAAPRTSLRVEQLHFNFVVSVMHVTPFEHFVDD